MDFTLYQSTNLEAYPAYTSRHAESASLDHGRNVSFQLEHGHATKTREMGVNGVAKDLVISMRRQTAEQNDKRGQRETTMY